nr:putative hydro-lyase KRH_21160 [Aegilops tauschii subsp. strangulata]
MSLQVDVLVSSAGSVAAFASSTAAYLSSARAAAPCIRVGLCAHQQPRAQPRAAACGSAPPLAAVVGSPCWRCSSPPCSLRCRTASQQLLPLPHLPVASPVSAPAPTLVLRLPRCSAGLRSHWPAGPLRLAVASACAQPSRRHAAPPRARGPASAVSASPVRPLGLGRLWLQSSPRHRACTRDRLLQLPPHRPPRPRGVWPHGFRSASRAPAVGRSASRAPAVGRAGLACIRGASPAFAAPRAAPPGRLPPSPRAPRRARLPRRVRPPTASPGSTSFTLAASGAAGRLPATSAAGLRAPGCCCAASAVWPAPAVRLPPDSALATAASRPPDGRASRPSASPARC